MRKLVLLFLFVSAGVSGQITTKGKEVAEPVMLSAGENLPLEITYTEEGNHNNYVMLYRNREYANIQDWRTIGFAATPEDVNSLYRDWVSILEGPKGVEKEYQLNTATAKAFHDGKVLYVYVDQPGESMSYFALNKKGLAKAFGVTGN